MNASTLLLLQIMGPLLICMSLGLFFNKEFFPGMINKMDAEPMGVYIGGLMSLVLGIVIILKHNLWTSPEEVIVTIIGWLALVKGILLVIFPKYAMNIGKMAAKTLPVASFIYLIIGGYLSWIAYFADLN